MIPVNMSAAARACLRRLAASAAAGCLFVTAAMICPESVAAGRTARGSDANAMKQRHAHGASQQRKPKQTRPSASPTQAQPKPEKARRASKLVVQRRPATASRSAHLDHRSAARAPRLHPRADAPGVREAPVRQAEAERLALHIAQTWRMDVPQAQRIVRAAYAQAREQQLSPTLILAVVAQESSFRPSARSRRGAQGLMQVIPRYHPEKLKGLPAGALLQPETNISVGAQVLAEYLERLDGRLDPALTRYSGKARAYPAKVRAWWSELERVRSIESDSSSA